MVMLCNIKQQNTKKKLTTEVDQFLVLSHHAKLQGAVEKGRST